MLLISEFQELKAHPDAFVKRSASGFLWNVTGQAEEITGTNGDPVMSKKRNNNRNGHVMLSYDWGHKPVVLRLNQELQRNGILTWMDVDRMSKVQQKIFRFSRDLGICQV